MSFDTKTASSITRDWIDRCLTTHRQSLTPKELTFLQKLQRQVNLTSKLSVREFEQLEKIYMSKVP